MGRTWSSGHMGERKERGSGVQRAGGEELRVRTHSAEGRGPCTRRAAGQVTETIHEHTDDSDMCVS